MVATASPVPTPPVSPEAPSPRGALRPVPRGRLPALALAALLLASCGRAAGGGAALPAGCGPRAARAPATPSAIPTAAGPVSSPQGAAVTAIAAGGGRLFASSYNAADGRRLFTSADGGELWRPLALPSGVPPGWSLQPLALSPGGHSRDGGRTWRDIAMAVGDPPVEPGGLRAGPGSSVRVATDEGVFVFQPTG